MYKNGTSAAADNKRRGDTLLSLMGPRDALHNKTAMMMTTSTMYSHMYLYVFLSGRVHYLETGQQTGFSCYYSQSSSTIYQTEERANKRLPLYVVAPNSAVNNVLDIATTDKVFTAMVIFCFCYPNE